MRATSHQSGEVGHVDEVDRAHLVGNLAHARKVDDARIGAASADDHLGPFFFGKALEFVVVDRLGFLRDAVGNDLVSLAGKIEMMAVRQVAAMRQIQAEDRVARLQNGGIRGHVGLRAGVRLHVDDTPRQRVVLRAMRARFSTTSVNSQPP